MEQRVLLNSRETKVLVGQVLQSSIQANKILQCKGKFAAGLSPLIIQAMKERVLLDSHET